MTASTDDREIFDRRRRRHFRDRAFARTGADGFLNRILTEELVDRLADVKREFADCLVIGQAAPALRQALQERAIEVVFADAGFQCAAAQGGVQCDEDRLPFADHSFDLVINIATLDSVNDLPGALRLACRVLRPDGFFLAGFVGAESLTALKSILLAAEGDRISAHVHPQIDIRTAGDLMARAGFALPVVDSDSLRLRYSAFDKLIADIRDMGGGNLLQSGPNALSRASVANALAGFAARQEPDGKVSEQIELIYLCGWSPHPDQPVPAKRGSGRMSLKTALEKKPPD